jgi:KaiC/GvpD/RAD55 family RecA-like ATPase
MSEAENTGSDTRGGETSSRSSGLATRPNRQSTGVPGLDEMLGGGLLPGALTVVVGATGIGKTQLGLQYASAGAQQEGRRGIVFDCSSRGDSQSHREYARRMFDWRMSALDVNASLDLEHYFRELTVRGPERNATVGRNATEGVPYSADYLHVFDYHGRRVTRRDLDWDDWQDWQAELNTRLRTAIAFLYGNFVRGARRVVIDGIEPVDRPGESIQFNLFEYVYHQVLRKDPQWVARDLFREAYRRHADEIAAHVYDPASIGCLLLYTSAEMMLDELISRRLDEGDALSNANTLIYMGKIREGNRLGRGLYIAKHRGSACDERIVEYKIDDRGLRVT